MRARTLLAPFLLLFVGSTALAADKPKLDAEFFNDLTDHVDGSDKVLIARTLREASQKSRTQLVLVAINHMKDYPGMPQEIGPFADALREHWKVGDPETRRGLVVVVAVQDRKHALSHSQGVDAEVASAVRAGIAEHAGEKLRLFDIAQAMKKIALVLSVRVPEDASWWEALKKRSKATQERAKRGVAGIAFPAGIVCTLLGLVALLVIGFTGMRAITGRLKGYSAGGLLSRLIGDRAGPEPAGRAYAMPPSSGELLGDEPDLRALEAELRELGLDPELAGLAPPEFDGGSSFGEW